MNKGMREGMRKYNKRDWKKLSKKKRDYVFERLYDTFSYLARPGCEAPKINYSAMIFFGEFLFVMDCVCLKRKWKKSDLFL